MRPLACLLLALCAAGCCREYGSSTRDRGPESWSNAPPQGAPPSLSLVPLPAWPPLGKGSVIQINASDASGDLSRLDVTFARKSSRSLSGGLATVSVPVEELGEGYRALQASVLDLAGGRATLDQPGVLIDMSPPVIEIGQLLLRKQGDQLAFWVADQWILGSVEVRLGELVLRKEFPEKIPSTLGKDWDLSWVAFPSESLPAGSHEVSIVVADAAGNKATSVLDLVIDDTPPTVTLLEPASGLEAAGSVLLRATAEDDLDGPVEIEVLAEGAPLARLPGPEVSLAVDLTTYLPGPLSLQVVAVDAAGNRSPPAEVLVVVVAP